jgi:hypothetical protein
MDDAQQRMLGIIASFGEQAIDCKAGHRRNDSGNRKEQQPS